MKNKTCFIQVDLDGLQTITRDCSREDFSSRPDYVYQSGLENLLELCERFRIKATLFVVGSDLQDPAKLALLRQAQRRGHEFANHSHTHPRWFKRLSPAQKREEIERCHKSIEDALGTSPRAFRAPGYSISSDALPILMELGYLYDGSVLPSGYDSLISRSLYRGANDEIGLMYEPFSWRHLLRPNQPYRPSLKDIYRAGKSAIWEFPVTCIPFLKFPFHASYVVNTSYWLFRLGAWGLKFSSSPITYLFHLKDFSRDLEPGDLARCVFNPISPKRLPERLRLLAMVLEHLAQGEVCLASEYVQRLNAKKLSPNGKRD